MSKHFEQDHTFSQKPLGFLRFWSFISSEVGDHRLSIDPTAKDINEIFNSNSVHATHVKDLVLKTLTDQNKPLEQPVDLTNLLDLLGQAAYDLRSQGADDLFDIELLEEIAWHISSRFLHLIRMPFETELDPPHRTASPQVISIVKYRTIRANQQN